MTVRSNIKLQCVIVFPPFIMGLLQSWKLHVILCLFSIVIIHHVLPLLIYLVFIVLAVIGGVVLAVVYQPSPYKRRDKDTFPIPKIPMVDVPLSRVKPYPPPSLKPKLLSPRIDSCLQEVLNLTLEFHVIPTYKLVCQDHEAFFNSIVPQIWKVLISLLQRMGQIDTMKLVSQDIVQLLRTHFENFRGIHYRGRVPQNNFPNLLQFPYLENPEHELNFLRQVSEVLFCVFLPKDVLECTPVRVLAREYLACHILQPTIDMICDPDYINQKLLAHLIKREEAMERGKNPLAYKYKDFEDFMGQIKKCEDIEELQILRQQIITDIIQAKAVYKMKHSNTTGLHGKQFPIPIPAEKLKMLMGRDLELYIRQLGTAKTSCDRQLRKRGEECEEEATPVIGSYVEQSLHTDTPLGIPFETVMKNEVTRMYLFQFLEECGFSHLLGVWIATEDLKLKSGTSFKVDLEKLYNRYLSFLSSEFVHIELDKVKAIEEFLSDHGQNPESCLLHLAKIQQSVFEEIHDLFYQNFLCSEQYRELLCQNNASVDFDHLENISVSSQMDEDHHKKKLKSLKIRLEDKDNELSLMPEEVQSCPSLTQRKRALQKDCYNLREEIKKLEHYIDHTEEWFDTIGQWSIEVHSVDLSKTDHNDRNPLFIIVVHRPETMGNRSCNNEPSLEENQQDSTQSLSWQHHQRHQQFIASTVDSDDTCSELSEHSDSSNLQSRSGWALGRHLSEFEKLHEKVIEICPYLQFPPLPKRRNPFQHPDANSPYWQKYLKALQVYLCRVLKDERLKECEEVFNFVSHASDSIKTKPVVQPEKKNHFSFSNLPVIQSIPGFGGNKEGQPEETGKELDATAEYMYLLVSEIFELDHFSRVLRKQLVELVQLTYGKSIDREVQDTMNWVFSEPMLLFYLETFKNSMWPGGKPASPLPTRSDEDKSNTKEEAKAKFLKSSPQALQTILGQRNCQIGMRKIYELLQDPKGNKQLFYALLEVLLYLLVPELQTVEIEGGETDWKDV